MEPSPDLAYDAVTIRPAVAGQARRSKLLGTYGLLVAFVFLRSFGNLSLAWGTKHGARSLAYDPRAYFAILLNPYVTLGIAMMIVALVVRLALLAVADLSFVLPMTAIGYVLAALFGSVFLHEQVTPKRWLGTVLIFIGAALVGSTSQNTTPSAVKAATPAGASAELTAKAAVANVSESEDSSR